MSILGNLLGKKKSRKDSTKKNESNDDLLLATIGLPITPGAMVLDAIIHNDTDTSVSSSDSTDYSSSSYGSSDSGSSSD